MNSLFLEVIGISLSVDSSFLTAFKYVGAGSATISMAGSAIGIGLIFGALIIAFVETLNKTVLSLTMQCLGLL